MLLSAESKSSCRDTFTKIITCVVSNCSPADCLIGVVRRLLTFPASVLMEAEHRRLSHPFRCFARNICEFNNEWLMHKHNHTDRSRTGSSRRKEEAGIIHDNTSRSECRAFDSNGPWNGRFSETGIESVVFWPSRAFPASECLQHPT